MDTPPTLLALPGAASYALEFLVADAASATYTPRDLAGFASPAAALRWLELDVYPGRALAVGIDPGEPDVTYVTCSETGRSLARVIVTSPPAPIPSELVAGHRLPRVPAPGTRVRTWDGHVGTVLHCAGRTDYAGGHAWIAVRIDGETRVDEWQLAQLTVIAPAVAHAEAA